MTTTAAATTMVATAAARPSANFHDAAAAAKSLFCTTLGADRNDIALVNQQLEQAVTQFGTVMDQLRHSEEKLHASAVAPAVSPSSSQQQPPTQQSLSGTSPPQRAAGTYQPAITQCFPAVAVRSPSSNTSHSTPQCTAMSSGPSYAVPSATVPYGPPAAPFQLPPPPPPYLPFAVPLPASYTPSYISPNMSLYGGYTHTLPSPVFSAVGAPVPTATSDEFTVTFNGTQKKFSFPLKRDPQVSPVGPQVAPVGPQVSPVSVQSTSASPSPAAVSTTTMYAARGAVPSASHTTSSPNSYHNLPTDALQQQFQRLSLDPTISPLGVPPLGGTTTKGGPLELDTPSWHTTPGLSFAQGLKLTPPPQPSLDIPCSMSSSSAPTGSTSGATTYCTTTPSSGVLLQSYPTTATSTRVPTTEPLHPRTQSWPANASLHAGPMLPHGLTKGGPTAQPFAGHTPFGASSSAVAQAQQQYAPSAAAAPGSGAQSAAPPQTRASSSTLFTGERPTAAVSQQAHAVSPSLYEDRATARARDRSTATDVEESAYGAAPHRYTEEDRDRSAQRRNTHATRHDRDAHIESVHGAGCLCASCLTPEQYEAVLNLCRRAATGTGQSTAREKMESESVAKGGPVDRLLDNHNINTDSLPRGIEMLEEAQQMNQLLIKQYKRNVQRMKNNPALQAQYQAALVKGNDIDRAIRRELQAEATEYRAVINAENYASFIENGLVFGLSMLEAGAVFAGIDPDPDYINQIETDLLQKKVHRQALTEFVLDKMPGALPSSDPIETVVSSLTRDFLSRKFKQYMPKLLRTVQAAARGAAPAASEREAKSSSQARPRPTAGTPTKSSSTTNKAQSVVARGSGASAAKSTTTMSSVPVKPSVSTPARPRAPSAAVAAAAQLPTRGPATTRQGDAPHVGAASARRSATIREAETPPRGSTASSANPSDRPPLGTTAQAAPATNTPGTTASSSPSAAVSPPAKNTPATIASSSPSAVHSAQRATGPVNVLSTQDKQLDGREGPSAERAPTRSQHAEPQQAVRVAAAGPAEDGAIARTSDSARQEPATAVKGAAPVSVAAQAENVMVAAFMNRRRRLEQPPDELLMGSVMDTVRPLVAPMVAMQQRRAKMDEQATSRQNQLDMVMQAEEQRRIALAHREKELEDEEARRSESTEHNVVEQPRAHLMQEQQQSLWAGNVALLGGGGAVSRPSTQPAASAFAAPQYQQPPQGHVSMEYQLPQQAHAPTQYTYPPLGHASAQYQQPRPPLSPRSQSPPASPRRMLLPLQEQESRKAHVQPHNHPFH